MSLPSQAPNFAALSAVLQKLRRELSGNWESSLVVQAVARTAGAWLAVIVALTLVLGLLRLALQGVIGDGNAVLSLSVWGVKGALLLVLMALGSTLTLTADTVEWENNYPIDVVGPASISGRYSLLIVWVLAVVAIRLAQSRRPAIDSRVRYAAASAGTSALVVIVFAILAGGSTDLSPADGNIEQLEQVPQVSSSLSLLVPVVCAALLTIFALVGISRLQTWSSLDGAVVLLRRAALAFLAAATALGFLGLVLIGLSGGTGALPDFGGAHMVAALLAFILLLPQLAVLVAASALQMRPGLSAQFTGLGSDSRQDLDAWFGELTDQFANSQPAWLPLVSLVVLVTVVVSVGHYAARHFSQGDPLLWAWAAGVFGVAGTVLGWFNVVSLAARARIEEYDVQGPSSAILSFSGPFGVLDFGVRSALLGALLGLLAHPSVLPRVKEFSSRLPARTLITDRLAWTARLTADNSEWPRPEVASRGTVGIAIGVAVTAVAALAAFLLGLALLAGQGVLGGATDSSAQAVHLASQNGVEHLDGPV